MPHIMIDYSENIEKLDEIKLLTDLNRAIFATGLFKNANDIKARIKKVQSFLIGFEDSEQAYIHVKLFILSGRTDQEKQTLVRLINDELQRFNGYTAQGLQLQLCTELNEIGVYHKSIKNI